MVLHGIQKGGFGPNAIGQNDAIAGGPIVIGGGKALVVEPPAAAGRDDGGLGADHMMFAGLEVEEYGASDLALVVHDELNGR